MRTRLPTSVIGPVVAAFLVASCGLASAAATDLRVSCGKTGVAISIGDRPVLHYRWGNVKKKPYVDRLFSPAGVQILRDAPSDHLHHHGLMYAVMIDGVNYWEEFGPKFGDERGQPPRAVKRVRRGGLVQDIEWLAAGSQKPAMIELRAIDVVKSPDLGATLVEWQCRFETPPGRPSLTFGGHHYHGLGMRFVPSMDKGGHFIYADDKTPVPRVPQGANKPIRNEWLTPVKWCAYTAKADGRPVTVAMFDAPHNFRHPATMYTLAREFAYISATLDEERRPFKIEADQVLELCYAVALWDGEKDRATIEKLYQDWLHYRAVEPENFFDSPTTQFVQPHEERSVEGSSSYHPSKETKPSK